MGSVCDGWQERLCCVPDSEDSPQSLLPSFVGNLPSYQLSVTRKRQSFANYCNFGERYAITIFMNILVTESMFISETFSVRKVTHVLITLEAMVLKKSNWRISNDKVTTSNTNTRKVLKNDNHGSLLTLSTTRVTI